MQIPPTNPPSSSSTIDQTSIVLHGGASGEANLHSLARRGIGRRRRGRRRRGPSEAQPGTLSQSPTCSCVHSLSRRGIGRRRRKRRRRGTSAKRMEV